MTTSQHGPGWKTRQHLPMGCEAVIVILFLAACAVAATAQANSYSYQILHRFSGCDGSHPEATPILDPSGNLYGTTTGSECKSGNGTVWKLSASGEFTVLHTFKGPDGSNPYVGRLIRDQAGNLYGTTISGGDPSCGGGCGTVYKITSSGKFISLFKFTESNGKSPGGKWPSTSLLLDKHGNLYGTTEAGGTGTCYLGGCGTVFKLAPPSYKGGRWTRTVLYNFNPNHGDYPLAGLIADGEGNLYGTTMNGGHGGSYCYSGGGSGCGVVYKLSKAGEETVLHNCKGQGKAGANDCNGPFFDILAQDAQGNFYGTSQAGGSSSNCYAGCGVVFEVTKSGTYSTLYAFEGAPNGWTPAAGVVLDPQGNLYGTTYSGGTADFGTVFEVSPQGEETILHNFAGGATDGRDVYAGVVRDDKGNLYGATFDGGGSGCFSGHGCGTVFKLTPSK